VARREGSGSFLKKRTKKLLFIAARAVPAVAGRGQGQVAKVFCFFFSKKKPLPCLAVARREGSGSFLKK
jgi:hypothetical protein